MKWHDGLIAGKVVLEFTFEEVGRLVQVILNKRFHQKEGEWIVGYDTRFQADAMARFCAEILAAHQTKVFFSKEPVPYGAILHKLHKEQAIGAIYITGGEHGVEYNGIRFLGPAGEEIHKDEWEAMEQQMKGVGSLASQDYSIALSNGQIEMASLMEEYLRFLRETIDIEYLKSSPLRVACDSMYGSAQGIIQQLLWTAERKIEEIHLTRHSMFGGLCPKPARDQLSDLLQVLQQKGKHVGIAWDAEGRKWSWINRTTGNLLPGSKLADQLRKYLQHKNKRVPKVWIENDGIFAALVFLQMLADESI